MKVGCLRLLAESGRLIAPWHKKRSTRQSISLVCDFLFFFFFDCLDLKPTDPCLTEYTPLIGSYDWSKTLYVELSQKYGLDTSIAEHLSCSYGDQAYKVAEIARSELPKNEHNVWPIDYKKLSAHHPYLEAEVRYSCRHEFACTAADVLGRRTRLAFINAKAAHQALPRVIEIMAEELNWDKKRKEKEYQDAMHYLKSMGLDYIQK